MQNVEYNCHYLYYFKNTNFTENNFRYEDIIFVDVNTPGPGWPCQFLEVKVWNNKNSGLSIGLAWAVAWVGWWLMWRKISKSQLTARCSRQPGQSKAHEVDVREFNV